MVKNKKPSEKSDRLSKARLARDGTRGGKRESTQKVVRGTKRGRGRPPGAQNIITSNLKVAISEAAASVGFDGHGLNGTLGYMQFLAMTEPKTFATLLARAIPMEVEVRHSVPATFKSMDEVYKTLREHNLPVAPLRLVHHGRDTPLEGEILPPVSSDDVSR